MKIYFLAFISLSCILTSCRKVEYLYTNQISMYKNYPSGDTIPFDISNLTDTIDSSFIHPNKALYLNAYDFVFKDNIKFYKVNDSLYHFLYNKYLNCELEYEWLRKDEFVQKSILKIPKDGCFYFCGLLPSKSSIKSLVFLQKDYPNSLQFAKLILYNIKNNKIISMIKLSEYQDEEKREDVGLRTYLINNQRFITIYLPYQESFERSKWNIVNRGSEIEIETLKNKKQETYYFYSTFVIDMYGYVLFPRFIEIENIQTLDKIGERQITNYM